MNQLFPRDRQLEARFIDRAQPHYRQSVKDLNRCQAESFERH